MSPLSIDAATWQTLSRLIDEALDLPPVERDRWLADLPSEHASLRPQLEDLLRRIETSGTTHLPVLSALEAAAAAAGGSDSENDLHPGDTVGAYRLVRPIGQGGMGTVWLAERSDGLIQRPVALKLPHDSWQRSVLVERMARERAILAALNHPNIARLYDAGVTSNGLPFLAIEYVEGERFDDFCRKQALDLRARLRLFLQVAQAVAHAHAHLVVHRDLKPSNILVTGDGDVRLLDFGIARLLEADSGDLTRVSGRVLTPHYASPEQLRGEPIGVASDIYAIGVVLCELLTGHRPYQLDRDTSGAIEDAILRQEPVRPSLLVDDANLRRALRGDLDTIVLKALKKNAEERYPTVAALADDLERYLQGFPVRARPDSRAYRFARFVRRHRVGVIAGAGACAALIAGTAVALWQARVAILEKERAENVTAFISAIFRDANPYHRETQAVTAADLLHQARQRIGHIDPARADLRVPLLHLVGSSLLGLGDIAGAGQVAREAITEAANHFGAHHAETLRARLLLAQIARFRGDTAEMRRELEAITPHLRRQAAADRDGLILALTLHGHLGIDEGRYDEALVSADEALRMAKSVLGPEDPATAAAAKLLAEAHLYGSKTPEEAVRAAEHAHQLVLAAYREFPRHPEVIQMREIYGRALASSSNIADGIIELEHSIRDSIEVLGPTHVNLGFALGNLARLQRAVGDIRAAIENNSRSLEIHAMHAQRESFTYAGGLTARGLILLAARRPEEALADLTESAATIEKLFGPTHEETLIARHGIAHALARLGRYDEAEEVLAPVIETYRTLYSEPLYKPHRPHGTLGLSRRLRGDFAGALSIQRNVLRMVEDGGNSEWDRMPVLQELGTILVELDQPAEAAGYLEEAIALYEKRQRLLTPDHAEALVSLGRAHFLQKRPAEALPLFEKADAFWRDFDPANPTARESASWLERGRAVEE